MTGDTCPACGQALPPQDDCICGHSRAMHNFTPGRRKTECSRFGPRGKCPCESYRPLEVPMPEDVYLSDHDKPPLDSSHCDARALALLGTSATAYNTADEAAQAMRAIAARALNVADCRILLEMCGLLPYESGRRPHSKAAT